MSLSRVEDEQFSKHIRGLKTSFSGGVGDGERGGVIKCEFVKCHWSSPEALKWKTNTIDFSPAASRSNSLRKVHFCRVASQSALESSVFIVKSLREGFPNLHSLLPSRLSSAAGLFLVLLFPVGNNESKQEYKRARKRGQKEKDGERSREKGSAFLVQSPGRNGRAVIRSASGLGAETPARHLWSALHSYLKCRHEEVSLWSLSIFVNYHYQHSIRSY